MFEGFVFGCGIGVGVGTGVGLTILFEFGFCGGLVFGFFGVGVGVGIGIGVDGTIGGLVVFMAELLIDVGTLDVSFLILVIFTVPVLTCDPLL